MLTTFILLDYPWSHYIIYLSTVPGMHLAGGLLQYLGVENVSGQLPSSKGPCLQLQPLVVREFEAPFLKPLIGNHFDPETQVRAELFGLLCPL